MKLAQFSLIRMEIYSFHINVMLFKSFVSESESGKKRKLLSDIKL